jgi:hypothetical protein
MRKLLIVLLGLGTAVGFAGGAAALARHHNHPVAQGPWGCRRDGAFEASRFHERVAETCVRAARATWGEHPDGPRAAPGDGPAPPRLEPPLAPPAPAAPSSPPTR